MTIKFTVKVNQLDVHFGIVSEWIDGDNSGRGKTDDIHKSTEYEEREDIAKAFIKSSVTLLRRLHFGFHQGILLVRENGQTKSLQLFHAPNFPFVC